jgi:hypothetical protein
MATWWSGACWPILARVGDMPDTALSGIAADEAAGTEYDIINQSINHIVESGSELHSSTVVFPLDAKSQF